MVSVLLCHNTGEPGRGTATGSHCVAGAILLHVTLLLLGQGDVTVSLWITAAGVLRVTLHCLGDVTVPLWITAGCVLRVTLLLLGQGDLSGSLWIADVLHIVLLLLDNGDATG